MANKIGSILIDLAMNSARLVSEVDRVNRKLDTFGSKLGTLAKAAATIYTAKKIFELSKAVSDVVDKYDMLEGRLKLVAKEGENLASTQQKLFKLAQGSRSAYDDTIDLYTRLARSTKDLEVNQATLLATTEAINKAVILSGVSAESANAAIIQLGQGLASGALRGDELRSVLEQTPRLAQAIADGMGVTVGKLRDLGKEGKITSEEVINALIKQKDVIEQEYSKMPTTVGQSLTLLTNELEIAVSKFDKFNSFLRDGISTITEWVKAWNISHTVLEGQERLNSLLEKRAALFDKFGRLREQKKIGPFATEEAPVIQLRKIDEDIARLREQIKKESEGKPIDIVQTIKPKILLDEKTKEEILERFTSFEDELERRAQEIRETSHQEFISDEGSFRLQSLQAHQSEQEERLRIIQEGRWREVDVVKETNEEKKRLEESHRNFMLSTTASFFGSLAALIGQGSKRSFERSKMLARAETIVSTFAAAQLAYHNQLKVGDPGAQFRAVAAAAAAVTAGLARLAAINRTTFSSATASASSTGAGTYTATPSSGPITPGNFNNQPQQQVSITIVGDDKTTFTTSQVVKLINSMRDVIGLTDIQLIPPNSRNAADIAALAT